MQLHYSSLSHGWIIVLFAIHEEASETEPGHKDTDKPSEEWYGRDQRHHYQTYQQAHYKVKLFLFAYFTANKIANYQCRQNLTDITGNSQNSTKQ
jgi:hypothetical protein